VGKVVATNITGNGSSENMAIARYLPNGTLDSSFGSGGLVNIDVDSASDEARAVRVMADNGLLVAGTLSTSAHADFGIVKLRADGALDTTFGETDIGSTRKGYVRLDIAGVNFHDSGYAMAVQKDGRIVVAGTTPVFHDGFNYNQVALARFSADGVLDTTFGSGGVVKLDPFFGAAGDVLTTIALDQAGNPGTDGRIVIGGYTFGRNCAFLARVNANGSVDTTFGTGGRVILVDANASGVRTGMSLLYSARLAADGKIIALGQGGDRGMTVMRFSANGTLDSGFGTAGRSTIKFSGVADYDMPAALALQGNGKIVAAGYATSRATGSAHEDFFVTRWLANGAVDTGFGDANGYKVVQVSTLDDSALAVAVEPSGNILAGGYTTRPGATQPDFALLRLIGDPDRIFHDGFDAGF